MLHVHFNKLARQIEIIDRPIVSNTVNVFCQNCGYNSVRDLYIEMFIWGFVLDPILSLLFHDVPLIMHAHKLCVYIYGVN
jgi:hypothetical protein